MSCGVVKETGHKRIQIGVSSDFGGIDVELPPPDQAGLLTEVDDLLEEALEEVDTKPLSDAGQAGVIRQRLIQGVAEIPAMGKIETRRFDELPLGADALEEHHQLQLEEDHRIDRGPAALGVQLPRPVADEAEVERVLQVTVEVVPGNQGLERDRDRLRESTRLGGTEHGGLRLIKESLGAASRHQQLEEAGSPSRRSAAHVSMSGMAVAMTAPCPTSG